MKIAIVIFCQLTELRFNDVEKRVDVFLNSHFIEIEILIFGYLSDHAIRSSGRRWNYDLDTLEKAVEAVCSGAMIPTVAAKVFGVPKTTLYTRRSKMTKKTDSSQFHTQDNKK